MKLFSLFTVFAATVFAQAPPESKTCPDCIAMDAAYKDEVKQNPGLIDEYVQMVQGLCASAGSMQKLCEQVAGPALKKYLTKIDHEDSRQYCTEITLCTPTMRQFMNLYAESDCTACTTFMADLSAIAQYDPPHFKQIFDAIVKGLCAEVGGFESKVCYQEGAKNEEKARQAMINGDPEAMCQGIMFC